MKGAPSKAAMPAVRRPPPAWQPAAPARDPSRVAPAGERRRAGNEGQSKYGNAEVARVATQPQGGAGVRAGGPLPEAGALATRKEPPRADTRPGDKKPRAGGHGKPSASPGVAKAAVEAKGKEKAKKAADKKAADKAGEKKEYPGKAAGKGAAAEGKDAAGGKEKGEKGGGQAPDAGGKDGGETRGREPAAAAGGFVSEAPPPRPRLEGTQAAPLPVPTLDEQQRERIRGQTGFSVTEHYARVQVHLDRLSAYATSEQFAIVVHIELIEAEVRRDLDNAAALIGPAVSAGIGRVRGACGTARAGINGASEDALKAIEAHATDADKKVDAAALTSKAAVDKAVAATSPAIRALYEETMAPLRTLLDEKGKKFAATGVSRGKEMADKGVAIDGKLGKLGGNDIDAAIHEKQGVVAKDQAVVAQKDLVQAGERGKADVLAQEPTLGLSFLAFVNPVAVKVEQVGGDDAKKTQEKGSEVRIRLATDYERTKEFVEETAKRALKALDALERSAVRQLEEMGRGLQEMAAARRDQLCSAILAGQEPAAAAWAEQMAAVNELVADGQVVDWRRLDPRFVAALDAMHALSTRQRLDFDAQAREGFADTRGGMDEDRRGIDEAADSYVHSALDTRKQAADMRQAGATFGKGFRDIAKPAVGVIGEFQATTEEKLGLSVSETRKKMADLLKTTTKSLETSHGKFDARLVEQIAQLETLLLPTFAAVGREVPANLGYRSKELVASMDRVGTDETRLFEALYGMTPTYGKALEYHWNHADHKHDLWWWLEDELSGDEYWTAYWYLKGDPVKGARFQLQASFHWYGDDVKQMESALRALTPEQLEKMNKDPEFKEVKEKLLRSLTGTDLLVAEALLAGRTARADALRLKDQIDAARAAGDDDKLHDLLAAIDPKRLPEVRREFLDILARNPMTEKPLVASSDKAVLAVEGMAFSAYVTKPVQTWEQGTGRGDRGRMVTKTLSEPSRKLAEALATTGEGSSDSRAARLAYEASRGGKPRPERLAKALDDPELVEARKNPILSDPQADPKKVADAKEVLDRLEARRAETMQKFAELRGADKETRKDPKRAQEFTEKAVADMFGRDKLGRELGTSMVRDGRAKPSVAIKFAVRGWGTNEELIRKTLRGMSRQEIEALKTDYADRFGDPKGAKNALFDDLGVFQNKQTAEAAGVEHATGGGFFTELSGDDRQEVEELLLGAPTNDRDDWRLARLKHAHQKGEGSTWATEALMSQEDAGPMGGKLGVAAKDAPPGAFASRSLDMNKARMEEMVEAAGGEQNAFDKDGNFKGVPGKFTQTDFRFRTAATAEMAANYKHHVDNLVDMITGAIAIIGAIVGTIVVTVLTAGTATPLVIGLWAAGIAAATGAAAMATKYALKGSRYGWEEAAVDGAITLVDAATAGLMAGAGAKAARAATKLEVLKAAARTPAQEAVAAKLIAQHHSRELARGFVRAGAAGFVGGTARTATADGTWDDGVLTGLGRSIKGGAQAAAVGVASHGAGQAFTRGTGLGKSLSNSTGYLRRGLGSGIAGAVGSMAGKGTELTLDSLGGRAHGPWYEALGEIALAGGRGFAENFGQGMAEVPSARRRAAQEAHDERIKMSDAERVARYGPNAADETGDLRFRRMAVAAALAHDPKTDGKAFLADLDLAVAQDRTLAEQHRQLVREFRREALASIPREQRGEFANVPIHVLHDAEFERFTGSLSGRAVTIFVEGEPQIVVRRSATPDALREEGIHVLQSRDPRWRERIGQLDETTLARWHELDLETQLSLYRTKLEIELDAQQRLRGDLVHEAEGTTDPARRARLLARIEESEQTFKALQARRDEVDTIGPERRAAIQRGDEARPQYLREPARLFSKKAPAADIPEAERPRAPAPDGEQEAAAKRPAAPAAPAEEPTPAKPQTLRELHTELSRLRLIEPGKRTTTDTARIAALETEIRGHYAPRSGETAEQHQTRLLGREEGESDPAYKRRLLVLGDGIAEGAAQFGRPDLKRRYDELLLSLKRPLAKVRTEAADLEAMGAARTKAQEKRLFVVLGEIDAHYRARPGENLAAVEARILTRAPGETDEVYRQRLLTLRGEVAHNAAAAGHANMLSRLDLLTEQLQRPMHEVRTEIEALASMKRDLTPDEKARLVALEKELKAHYLERPGETINELEQRLFAQGQHEKLEDYLTRLRKVQEEVFSGAQRTQSEHVLDHYMKLVAEVEIDVARLPVLRREIHEANAAFQAASRAEDAHRRAVRAGRLPPKNVPNVTRKEVHDLWETLNSKQAELKALENRGAARSARYQFADLGQVDPCFLPGTLIVTPTGLTPIDDLCDGDAVLARTPTGGPVTARVARVHRNATQSVVTLRFSGETVRTTRQHPFWSETHGRWIPAAALMRGDRLLTLAGPAAVESVTVDDDLQPTLNLEIEGLHTFLVGTAGALVHNGTKRPGFDDPVKRHTRIYRVVRIEDDGTETVIYIGKTWQGDQRDVVRRFMQHLRKKPEWRKLFDEKGPDGLPRVRVELEKPGHWTVFETAVWEEHYIRKYKLNRADLERLAVDAVDLQNKGVPLTKEAFNRYRSRFRGC